MDKKRIDFITLSPLLLLALLPFGNPILSNFITVERPEFTFQRYFSIPLIGLSIGTFFLLGIIRHGWTIPEGISKFIRDRLALLIILFTMAFTIFFSTFSVLRYYVFHSAFYDLGVYDNKVWHIADALPSVRSIIVSLTGPGHFQPILLLHAILYKIYVSPLILLVTQAITVASGVIPLYLLGRNILKNATWIVIIVLLYLLYPAIEFNSIVDFHPDHFYIPMALWAFYFAHKGRYISSIIVMGIGGLAKEPFLLGASFFGIYLALKHRRYMTGFIPAVFFLILFSVLFFYMLPALNYLPGEERLPLLEDEGYSYLFNFTDPHLFFKGLGENIMRKLIFVFFLLSPFLFLPIFQWKEFIPAIPPFAIQLLSTQVLHYNPESQYTAGIVSPIIIGFLFFVNRIQRSLGERYATAVLVMVLIMMLSANIARSPSPLSINFWNQRWSHMWNYTIYKDGAHERVIREAIKRYIPSDPEVTVSTQNNLNWGFLAHRRYYFCFPYSVIRPEMVQDFSSRNFKGLLQYILYGSAEPKRFNKVWADYVVLDMKRPWFIGDKGCVWEDDRCRDVDPVAEEFLKLVQQMKEKYETVFEKDGVVILKRRTSII
jgi:uncharacterized membrane protein